MSFEDIWAEAMATATRFGHRRHVHLTWLAVRRHGVPAATTLVAEGIQRTATAAGAPQKYHATMTRAWVELVGDHVERDKARDEERDKDAGDFDAFADRHPDLLDKDLLSRFYRPGTLDTATARTTWVEPDLAPFPRQEEPA
ncbi:hypothetical protein J7F03_10580 [Streptomyces sp. ISL-43]|uniref:hypothetical protein n=1 Tax=Streptomyces sp. ISL-43 TaxID=2819183 RepID=UPI001BE94466|nr:hypothetical protein [Streptomyces sp. ISL-43]MBT2447513.1 hypothetical protein [Streptomyces sp. ISL-43]